MRVARCAFVAAILLWTGGRAAWADENRIDFAHDIVPLLKKRCGECHTNGTRQGELSLDTRESILQSRIVVPGKSQESELIRRVESTDPEQRMPAKGPALTNREIGLLKAWIDQGLAWERGFSFARSDYEAPLRLTRPDLPQGFDDARSDLDRWILGYARARQIELNPVVDDATYARRASLDLIGLLPTREQLVELRSDPSPDRRRNFVSRLLQNRRAYAEHWLSFWNDLLRNDYRGTGYIDGGRKQISAWLYQSLADNKPYDQFARELLNPGSESEGFINGIKWRGRVNASQIREIQFSQNVSQVFFGVNLKCASCHDSFIDAWKLDDAYRLAAIVADGPLEIHRCDKATGRTATAGFLWPELGEIDGALPKPQRLQRLAELATHRDNGRFSRTIVNRVWQRLMGRGIVHPVDAMGSRPWSEELLDYLAAQFIDDGYDLTRLLERIADSIAYQVQHQVSESESSVDDYRFRGPELKRMTAEQFLDAIWQLTGTGPEKIDAPVQLVDFPAWAPPQQRFHRAALLHCDALMRSLGRPNREQVVTTRGDVLTTLQALDLANGEPLSELLQRGAANLRKRFDGETAAAMTDSLFESALGRLPGDEERATARQLLGEPASDEGVADLLWALVMLPEFQLVR
jgi:hypothetical protein